jgi:hypothetical protein
MKSLRSSCLLRFLAQHYAGTQTTPAMDRRLDVALRVVQLVSSSTIVCVWIYKSYSITLYDSLFALDMVACVGCVAHLSFRIIQNGFSSSYILSREVVLDCFTITPLLLQKAGAHFGGTFVTLSYLRVYRVLISFAELATDGVLEPYLSDMSTAVVNKIIEFLAVTFAIAGTFWILEGLGDFPFLYDSYINSGMGEISFLQSKLEFLT